VTFARIAAMQVVRQPRSLLRLLHCAASAAGAAGGGGEGNDSTLVELCMEMFPCISRPAAPAEAQAEAPGGRGGGGSARHEDQQQQHKRAVLVHYVKEMIGRRYELLDCKYPALTEEESNSAVKLASFLATLS
jgi:hypothetical protein